MSIIIYVRFIKGRARPKKGWTPTMMKHEFEELAGYEVSYEDYTNIIEPMYMAVNVSKQDFVKMIDKKRFALKTEKQILAQMKKLANELKESCEWHNDFDKEDKVQKLAKELEERFAAHVHVMTSTTCPDQRGCSFPSHVNYYTSNYTLIKTVWLAKPWYEA